MMVIDHGCEDSLPIGLPQSCEVGFKIGHRKVHVTDLASPDVTQVSKPGIGRRVGIGHDDAIWVVVTGDGECGAHRRFVPRATGARETPANL